MLNAHNTVPLGQLVLLLACLMVAGTLLCLPLYHFEVKRFVHSKLFTKIVFWIPIAAVFITALYLSNFGRLALLLVLLLWSVRELLAVLHKRKDKIFFIAYYALFSLAFLNFYLLGVANRAHIVELLIVICISSVLSDVFAFFFGNYLGKHKLPAMLNPGKSWEGVLGQVLGALAGVLLVKLVLYGASSLLLFLPVGIGSAVGDLANSFVKRRAGIKDWGNTIPGHGGLLDRFSSLAGSALLTFYFVYATGLI